MASEEVRIAQLSVIGPAREQANAGAHYLWSAAGNTPGNSDGAFYRPSKVQLHENVPEETSSSAGVQPKSAPFTPMLFAGFAHTSDQGTLSCAGRAALVGDLEFALKKFEENKGAGLGPALALKVKDLSAEQIGELQENMLTLDLYRWPRPNGIISNNNNQRSTIWGESCVDKRHFDCIGFINWCLSTGLQKHVHYGIPNFTNGAVGSAVPVHKAQLGDIVTVGAEHIGIVSENSTVIEAKDPAHGGVESPLDLTRWKQCFRLPDRFWKVGE